MQPKHIGEQVRQLLREGVSNRGIRKKLNCAAATISYHAKKIGMQKKRRLTYDWAAIQAYIDQGFSMYDAINKFGFSKGAWCKAVERGSIKRKKRYSEYTINELIHEFHGFRMNSYRKRLFRRHIAKELGGYACSECGLDKWRNKLLSLELDHIDGNPKNNMRDNLRLLCPNCHCTTPTWRGRNVSARVSRFES